MFEFDLQMFAEDTESSAVDTTSAEQTADSAETDNADNTEAQEEAEKEPIPEELEGLPEEAAREAMAEAAQIKNGEQEPAETEPDDSKIIKTETIPYARFKQKVDEAKALKEELEALKKSSQQAAQQPNMVNFQHPQQQYTQAKQPVQQQMPQLNLTPEVMKQIDELKKQEALRMSGLTQDDLDGMEYMEDDDPRKTQYQFALKMAENAVMSRIQQAQMEQMRQAEALVQAHDASVRDYNAFAQAEMKAPDFQNVMKFATEDFFFQRNPNEQQTLAGAYSRIEQNTASPVDVMLIKNYFAQAKAAYHSGKGGRKTTTNRANQAGSFPRSQQIDGASDNDAGVSVATLEKMLESKDWDEIPEKYQKMLMGN